MLVKKIDFFFKWEFDFVFSLDKEYMFTKEKLGKKKKKGNRKECRPGSHREHLCVSLLVCFSGLRGPCFDVINF